MTPSRLMRQRLPLRLLTNRTSITTTSSRTIFVTSASSSRPCSDPHSCLRKCNCVAQRSFAQVNDTEQWNRDIWFTSSAPRYVPPSLNGNGDHSPPDERTLQLGKTVRTLHERLPTLLKEPLPSDILSPNISLHLFPSTHPHLPRVSGRIAYVAALWTAPVAWGRMPLFGNVKLVILSERMVRNGGSSVAHQNRDEKLIVKWKTCGKTTHRDGTGGIYRGMGLAAARDPVDKIKDFISGTRSDSSKQKSEEDAEEFCGIFIFEFDEHGRIQKHTIEHTDEGGHYDKMNRVVSVTDWLLGQFNGKRKDEPALALCEERPNCGSIRLVDRRARY
ncbi:hypothetical protein HII31_11057 [Pseudocercospora fuligena]|uniref:Uncharacterized protein n=1 Tax=Pseudocercospora fuligena TaxID=685502 RepID=A0A8H6RB03_9PEZI|nr:hypothetical protein HII31_11057 [Pseudocercospora fuligena]